MKLRQKNSELKGSRVNFKNAAAAIFVVIIVAFFFYSVGINVYQRLGRVGPYRVEYQGKVVDKSITVNHTETGSYQLRILRIRDEEGKEFNIIVDVDLYDRTQIGMWIKKNDTGVEVSWNKIE